MASNSHSADSQAEDLIRAFVQFGCVESHLKTLLEKSLSQLENGLIDVEKPEVLQAQTEKIEDITAEIEANAQLRRRMMLKLFEMYDGDKDYWCVVKHAGIGAFTAWEVYEASDDDPELLEMALDANKRFIKALSHFLGVSVVECAACFGDMMRGKEHKNGRQL